MLLKYLTRSCCAEMLRSVMHAGSSTHSAGVKKLYTCSEIDVVVDSARLFDRLLGLVCSHSAEFAKAAPYIVADYCTTVERVTLYPPVKRVLSLAVYKLLDICSEHVVGQLNALLPAGSRHVFRLVYGEFDKYYKYSRRMSASDVDASGHYIQYLYSS